MAQVVEQLDEEGALRWEVLIQDRFGDTCGCGHVVHRGRMEAAFGEHDACDVEKLTAPLLGGEAGGHGARSDARLQRHDVAILMVEVARPELVEPSRLVSGQR